MEKGPRLWHAAASPDPSQVNFLTPIFIQMNSGPLLVGGITIIFVLYNHNAIIVHIKVMVVGGLTNNILAPQYVEKQHAEKVIHYFFLS